MSENQEQNNLPEKNDDKQFWGMPENTYCMLMHLSLLAGFVIPLAGLVLPIVMWATNKDQSAMIDAHGKNTLNWLISLLIYSVISFILIIVVVGVLGLIVLSILNIIFAIIAAIKANNNELWVYPMTIKFFKA